MVCLILVLWFFVCLFVCLVGWFIFVEHELFITFVFSLSWSVKISRSYGAVFPQCTSSKAAFDFSRCHCNKNCPSGFKTAENNLLLFRDLKVIIQENATN